MKAPRRCDCIDSPHSSLPAPPARFLCSLTVGLVFNPATPLDHAKYVLDKVDIILLMSVNPGFGGQSFIPSTLDKLREARKMIDESGYDIRLEVRLPLSTNKMLATLREVFV